MPAEDSTPERVPEPPSYPFIGGPAAGERGVLPDLEGALPRYVVVREPVEKQAWHWPDDEPEAHIGHVYRLAYTQDPAAWVYRFEHTLDCQGVPTITCPDCGETSAHKVDIAEGWCGKCKSRTRIRRYAVMRFTDPAAAPTGYEGRWIERDMVHLSLPPGPWKAQGTSTFERGWSGGYAEVFELTAIGRCG